MNLDSTNIVIRNIVASKCGAKGLIVPGVIPRIWDDVGEIKDDMETEIYIVYSKIIDNINDPNFFS
jgi:hypothetical protein